MNYLNYLPCLGGRAHICAVKTSEEHKIVRKRGVESLFKVVECYI
jgi:hypothetical protein